MTSHTDDADGEQPIKLAGLPLELLVKVCLAVGSADRASLRMVATTLASAVQEATLINGVATARLRTLLRSWAIRVRVLEYNGPCASCGQHHRTLRCALYVLQLRRALHVGARLALATARGAGRGNQLVLRGARADVGAEVRWRCDMRYMHTRGLARMLRA